MNPIEQFKQESANEVKAQGDNLPLQKLTHSWMDMASREKFSYHFEWLGRQIIQFPQDMVAIQERILSIKPDLTIEDGIAHGDSLILSASMPALPVMFDVITC